jgi:DNA-binding GntR family transcriptional regulator
MGEAVSLDQASANSAYDAILSRIAEGDLVPGQWLRESALSTQLGVSRTPVREALRALAAEGLVETVKNRGARVREWSDAQIAETYRLRALLEGYGARMACSTDDPSSLGRLHEIQDELETAINNKCAGFLDYVAELNGEFHQTVLGMANSPLLTGFVETLGSVSLVRRAFRGYSERDLARTVTSHRDIIVGIEARDPELAEAAMRGHILGARNAAINAFTLPGSH